MAVPSRYLQRKAGLAPQILPQTCYNFVPFQPETFAYMPLILTETHAAVRVISLNRPELINAFNRAMAAELQLALADAAADDQIRAVLLKGEGRGFCSGQDLAEAIDPNGPAILEIVEKTYNPIVLALRSMPKPVVCAVHGVAAGAGANVALAADLTLSAQSASWVQAFSKIGLIPDSGGTFMLPRLVGLQRAAGLCMLAEKINGEEAERLGLIWKCLPDDALFSEALALAERLSQMPTQGLALTKQAFNEGLNQSLQAQLQREAVLQAQAAQSHDHKEGVQAFLEKRKPNFNGK
jgi:2-(1,2-epoxy-1,2-dihydrophenyl)acetyl-CoA isomerase